MAKGSNCDGCPRRQDPEAEFCRMPHPQHSGLHPVCKSCGHCVLRGGDDDDISKLEQDP
jgi:hypothetical protein